MTRVVRDSETCFWVPEASTHFAAPSVGTRSVLEWEGGAWGPLQGGVIKSFVPFLQGRPWLQLATGRFLWVTSERPKAIAGSQPSGW